MPRSNYIQSWKSNWILINMILNSGEKWQVRKHALTLLFLGANINITYSMSEISEIISPIKHHCDCASNVPLRHQCGRQLLTSQNNTDLQINTTILNNINWPYWADVCELLMLCVEWTHLVGWLREKAWTIWTVPYLLIVGGQELSGTNKDKAENLDEYYGFKIISH